jgi:hypothetical protein
MQTDTTLTSTAQWSWSPANIGDLVDAARRAAELIGSATEVARFSVLPPSTSSAFPTVQVVLHDRELSEAIRMRLTSQDMLPHFIGTPVAGTWRAEVDDLVLALICIEEAE